MSKERIMVVEDEWAIANDMQRCLKNQGYTVSSLAASGEEAVQKAEEHKPDLILMDIVLRGKMDGIEAAGQIRPLLNIPIIYLTAYDNASVLERAKITEPFGYIIKPFEERELHTTIEMALYKHKAELKMQTLIQQLEDALSKVKLLSGILPICAACKKIRDGKGCWKHVESYVQDHSEADFTHSICPDCSKRLYPKLYKDKG